MRSAVRQIDDDFDVLKKDARWKVLSYLWTLMVLAAVGMAIASVIINYQNEDRMGKVTARLDDAFAFDFDDFATTPCRTCDGTQVIIHDGTPIVVSPYVGVNEDRRQFPQGIRTPCFESTQGSFRVRAQTVMGSSAGVLVDQQTQLKNPQGLAVSNYTIDCGDTAPCLVPADFCNTTFSPTQPYGPIYHITRTNVGSASDTLEHTCVCIFDWDPVAESNRTRPYCTEPMLLSV